MARIASGGALAWWFRSQWLQCAGVMVNRGSSDSGDSTTAEPASLGTVPARWTLTGEIAVFRLTHLCFYIILQNPLNTH
jgi:hypothetical protein